MFLTFAVRSVLTSRQCDHVVPPPCLWTSNLRERHANRTPPSARILVTMVNFCSMFNCSNRSNRDQVSFHCIPTIIVSQGDKTTELTTTRPSKHSTSGPHKAHMWQLKWLPPNGTHVGHTFFATVAHVWPTCDRCLAHMWPTYGRQEAHMWQTTGPHVAISRYINGKQEVNAWHSTGTEVAHVWQLLWPTTGPYVAMNRYRNGNQDAQTWQ